MQLLNLKSLPAELTWKNEPLFTEQITDDSFTITAGPETDWFIDPAGGYLKNNAPVGLFIPPDDNFLLSAKVTVDFGSIYDAGVLFLYAGEAHWAKLCFEYAPQKKPMVVSVVTRGTSDDSNSVPIDGDTLFLRVYKQTNAFAFHYSSDSHYWWLVRYFSLGSLNQLQLGFSAQSPTGQSCQVQFSEIVYQPGVLSDIRNGE